jgi:hypothetical protein
MKLTAAYTIASIGQINLSKLVFGENVLDIMLYTVL